MKFTGSLPSTWIINRGGFPATGDGLELRILRHLFTPQQAELALRLNLPSFFWDPLIRAAVLSRLGRKAEAQKAVDELLALEPDFRRRGRSLIRRVAYLDEHVEMLVEGLNKAGLEVL